MRDDLTKSAPSEEVYKVLKFLTKSIAQFLPLGASGTASELFDLVVADPAIKRRDRFMMSLAARLDELCGKGFFDPACLIDNEDVSAYLLHTMQVAMRSQGEEKLKSLREAAVRGTIAQDEPDRVPAYVVLGLLDRMTDYHLIRLRWASYPRPSYTLGQMLEGEHFSEFHFGQPTYADPTKLQNPKIVFNQGGVKRYAETQSVTNFRLARADLVALGLLRPVFQQEAYIEDRRQKTRPTTKVAGYEVTELGRLVVDYIQPVESDPPDEPPSDDFTDSND